MGRTYKQHQDPVQEPCKDWIDVALHISLLGFVVMEGNFKLSE